MRPLLALSFMLLSTLSGCSKKTEPMLKAPVALSNGVEMKAETKGDEQASKARFTKHTSGALTETEVDPAEFAHVLRYDRRTFVVLASPSSSSVDSDWATGDANLVSLDYPVVVHKEVDTAKLPSKILRQAGLSVQLVSGANAVCRGKLGVISMLGRVEPHYGVRMAWKGEDAEPGVTPPTPEEIAAEAWDLSEGGRLLVAELRDVEGDCTNAVYARASTRALPEVASPAAAPKALREASLSAFRALDDYQTIAASFAELALENPSPTWDTYEGAEPSIVFFSSEKGSYAYVSAYAGAICSAFEGKLEALFEVQGNPAKQPHLRLLYVGASDFAPTSMLMLGQEGAPTLLGFDATLAPRRNGQYRTDRLEVPFLDCPC